MMGRLNESHLICFFDEEREGRESIMIENDYFSLWIKSDRENFYDVSGFGNYVFCYNDLHVFFL